MPVRAHAAAHPAPARRPNSSGGRPSRGTGAVPRYPRPRCGHALPGTRIEGRILLRVVVRPMMVARLAWGAVAWLVAARGAEAIPEAGGKGQWCVGAPLGEGDTTAESVAAVRAERQVARSAQFRGSFRDLALWVDSPGSYASHHCEVFHEHFWGNDGLWVIEFDEGSLMRAELARMKELEIPVLVQRKRTLVVGGGESTGDSLGYDACGMETDKRFISVSTHAVSTPATMPRETKARMMQLAKHKSSATEDLLEAVSMTELVELIGHMEGYFTRNSFSGDGPAGEEGLNQAANWAAAQFAGYGFEVARPTFREDMTPQVIAELRGSEQPERVVVVGAHYDSRGTLSSSPTQRAPGADDNGSGSAALIELARVISESGIRFRHTLRLCLFTGEEQGLIGSRALASQYAEEGEQIIAMFNADMIGWKRPDESIVLAYMNRSVDMDLTEISMEITRTYVPEIGVDFTSGCCSDQQSFYENGFPAVGFFETPGTRVEYPQYHTSSDLLENLSSDQIYLLAKATMASSIVYAEPIA